VALLLTAVWFAVSFFLASPILVAQEDDGEEPAATGPRPGKDFQKLEPEDLEPKPVLDLDTTAFAELQKEYRAAIKAVIEPHRDAQAAFLAKQQAAADAMFKDASRSGNSRLMGAARDYQRIIEEATATLAEKGSFTLPGKVRRELEDVFVTARQEKEEMDRPVDPKLADIEVRFVTRFKELVAARATALEVEFPPEEIEAKLKEFKERDLVAKDTPAPTTQPGETNPVVTPSGTDPEFMPKVPLQPEGPVLAGLGTGDKWVTIGRWTGEIVGMEVITLDCANRQSDIMERIYNPMADAESVSRFKAIKPMPAKPNFAFRLLRIEGMSGVDSVLQWPSEKNRWQLTFRVKPLGEMVPENHGFDFQVSLPGEELAAAFGAGAVQADTVGAGNNPGASAQVPTTKPQVVSDADEAKKIPIRITTKPDGARVYVDDTLAMDRKTKQPMLSPCDLRVLPGKHNIRLEKRGYLPREFKDFVCQPGKRIITDLMPDPKLVSKTITVKAGQADWLPTGIQVKTGEKVYLSASGEWSCAEKKDRCGPGGIPNDKDHYRYYMDSKNDVRQAYKRNYGALLVKVSNDGEMYAVGEELEFKADMDGEIMLDINELPGKDRRGNVGSMEVYVVAPVQAQ